ncbi:hypothetical protein LCGC14_1081180 [marine sediment metagenome]|uniref:AP2/ERF domain-containing protein n=1 Tax=marine sediment metagenome TaxID=412755 RepID=A0A0F9MF79_9ZZZZ
MLQLIHGTVSQSKQYYPQWWSSLPSKADCTNSAIEDILFGGNMKRIPLTRGKFALVDDEDSELVNLFKWRAAKGRNTYYAVAWVCFKDDRSIFIQMHRLILNSKPHEHTDHADMNGLNNQKYNIRKCNRSQNQHNRKSCIGSSQYKGVSWCKDRGKWIVHIGINGKHLNIGRFISEIEAAKAYDAKAKELHGEFARLNFQCHPIAKDYNELIRLEKGLKETDGD